MYTEPERKKIAHVFENGNSFFNISWVISKVSTFHETYGDRKCLSLLGKKSNKMLKVL